MKKITLLLLLLNLAFLGINIATYLNNKKTLEMINDVEKHIIITRDTYHQKKYSNGYFIGNYVIVKNK